ncbi:MAG TPA: hypothetical protein PLV93_05590, partial [Microthrixaceae bacterium]|nr:hypothetical protein [Microthrixaceae bacterium]
MVAVEIPEPETPDDDVTPSRGSRWWPVPALAQRVTATSREVEKRLARQPLARLALAGPRTARYVIGEILGEDVPGVPHHRLTPGLVGHVIMDESIMALAVGPSRFPRRADYERV